MGTAISGEKVAAGVRKGSSETVGLALNGFEAMLVHTRNTSVQDEMSELRH